MDKIRRIYVEKKEHSNLLAEELLEDMKNNLQISNLEGIRLLNCYDITGIADDTFEKSKYIVFMEPPLDDIYENINLSKGELAFSVEYLPGQYDQRADSAIQAINAISLNSSEMPFVKSSKTYILKGKLSDDDYVKIKKYIINPIDSHEIPLDTPETLIVKSTEPKDIEMLSGFIECDPKKLEAIRKEMGLAMTLEDFAHCQTYFKSEEKRNPTITEIKVLDTYWSDHCRHTTFLTKIESVEFSNGAGILPIKEAYEEYLKERLDIFKDRKDKYVCLMDIALIGMRVLKKKGLLKDLDESEEINACSIKATVDVSGKSEEWLIMFKNETHNHPTEIEPFGGAATCLGGAIRDPLSGRSYVYQAMRVTGSGDPNGKISDTIEGKLPQRKISTGAANGYSSYGNQIGLATGHVCEIYDEGYVAKRMEIGAVIGTTRAENVIRTEPEDGDIVILLGGRTGRDGCGGATGSSKEHTEESILLSGAEVQKGNAPTERKIQRLFRKPEVTKLIKRCNDFGAGGVSVAIGELARGLNIDLDKVPKKYDGLDGTELAISESQERMAVVIKSRDESEFISFASSENLEAVKVASVTSDDRLKMSWRGKVIVNISRAFLDTNGAEQKTYVFVNEPERIIYPSVKGNSIKEKWMNNLRTLNVCAQKGLVEKFDATVGASTVLMPFGGKYQLTPAIAMASKIPLEKGETDTATIMSFGFDPKVSISSPFHGAIYAVIDSVNKIVATGGNPETIRLTFQEYFEKLRDEPSRWGKPFSALLGGFKAQMEMKIPSIGGKDSMSGSFLDLDVPPTLVSFAVNVADANNIISQEFKKPNSNIVSVNIEYDDRDMPDFNVINKLNKTIYKLINEKKILACHNIGFGGIGASLSKMSFGNRIGFNIKTKNTENLFKPNYGGFLFETDMVKDEIEKCLKDFKYEILGNTIETSDFLINGEEIDHFEALKNWISPLENVFPTKYFEDKLKSNTNLELYKINTKVKSNVKIAKPRAIVTVFPGTNSEYDTIKAFENAGSIAEPFVIKNLTSKDLKISIVEMAKMINNSQIVAIPGGFSAGDEPEGSGKFIAAVFKSQEVKEAIHNLLNNRDGLMIGICNGFQALLKLGLLPLGEIKDQDENSPTLTFNKINRHISCVLNTKVISNKSPWLYGVDSGDVYKVAISHGEGRFIASEDVFNELVRNNQIATQYVDLDGNCANDFIFNPNGSYMAVEGITSKDGRIFGKMGHSERIGKNVYKNVCGDYDMKIFESGINYYS